MAKSKEKYMEHLPDWARVGVEAIDKRHDEFCEIASRLKSATTDSGFLEIFEELYAHTASHFKAEEDDMDRMKYANSYEHKKEHEKALAELDYFLDKTKNGKIFFARAFAKDRLNDWFKTHVLNMDSDLARAMRLNSI
jgi:hemerythrin